MEFLIRVLSDGKFSNYLKHDAHLGQSINVKGPSGIFGLKENGFTARYFVAGGTGLAPILSMVRQMQEWDEPQKCVIYYGVNTEDEVFYVDELQQLATQMKTLEVRICVWKASNTWHGEKGTLWIFYAATCKIQEPSRIFIYADLPAWSMQHSPYVLTWVSRKSAFIWKSFCLAAHKTKGVLTMTKRIK